MRARLIALTVMVPAVTACGGGGGGDGGMGPGTRTLTSLELSPQNPNIPKGGEQQITATARDQNGAVLTVAAPTWQTSDAGKAIVSTGGLVTGVAQGPATITATVTRDGVTKSANTGVTVVAPPATSTVEALGNANQFNPGTVVIATNGSVTWHWNGLGHSVNFDPQAGAPANIGVRSTGSDSRAFTTPGTYGYECGVHPGMRGTVKVVNP